MSSLTVILQSFNSIRSNELVQLHSSLVVAGLNNFFVSFLFCSDCEAISVVRYVFNKSIGKQQIEHEVK